MQGAQKDTSESQASRAPVRMHPITLRFLDAELEKAFRANYFRHAVSNFRWGMAAGVFLWASSIPILHPNILAIGDRSFDLTMRFAVFIPVLLVGVALSFTPVFERIWEWVTLGISLVTIGAWLYYVGQVLTIPAEYGYVGIILITAFTYALLRLRFVLVVLITVVGAIGYMQYAVPAVYIFGITTILAALFLFSFGVVGCIAPTGWSARREPCSSGSASSMPSASDRTCYFSTSFRG